MNFSYCVDSENRHLAKPHAPRRDQQQQQQNSSNNDQQNYNNVNNYQNNNPLTDVHKLAEQAANMYAQNPAEKESYYEYYKDFYTKQMAQQVTNFKLQFHFQIL